MVQLKKEFTRLETIEDTQNETLYSKNKYSNDKYLKNVFDSYNLYDKLVLFLNLF